MIDCRGFCMLPRPAPATSLYYQQNNLISLILDGAITLPQTKLCNWIQSYILTLITSVKLISRKMIKQLKNNQYKIININSSVVCPIAQLYFSLCKFYGCQINQNDKYRTRQKEKMESEQQNSVDLPQQTQNDKTFNYNEVVAQSSSANRQEDLNPYDCIYFFDEAHRRASCIDCKREISRSISVLQGQTFRCVGCLAKQEPTYEQYTIIKSINFAAIQPTWKAHHQILLLNYLQKFGFGNWREIKQQMEFYGARYSEEELESHYYSCYLSQEDYLPKFSNNDSFFEKRCEPISTITICKNSVVNNPTSISSLATNAHREDYNHDQFQEIDDFCASHTPRDGKLIEYFNEKRNEFDVEYDQDAQLLLANLEFRDDDTEEETRIKHLIIEEYNRRLDKRNKIKEFVLQHRLLQENYQKEMDKNRNQHEKQAFQQLKPLARFTTLKQYNQLVRKVAFTKQLKSTIQGLRRLRRAHPSSYKNLDEFLNNQPEQSRPKKKNPNDLGIKTGKKVQQVLEKQFKLSKKDFQNLFQNLQTNGKKGIYKNVQAVMLQKNY